MRPNSQHVVSQREACRVLVQCHYYMLWSSTDDRMLLLYSREGEKEWKIACFLSFNFKFKIRHTTETIFPISPVDFSVKGMNDNPHTSTLFVYSCSTEHLDTREWIFSSTIGPLPRRWSVLESQNEQWWLLLIILKSKINIRRFNSPQRPISCSCYLRSSLQNHSHVNVDACMCVNYWFVAERRTNLRDTKPSFLLFVESCIQEYVSTWTWPSWASWPPIPQ